MSRSGYYEFFDLVSQVRAMRRLRPDPVPDELIIEVLNAGVQAPLGQNSQPWEARKTWFAQRYGAAMEACFGIPQDAAKRGHDRMNAQMRAICHQIDHLHEVPYLLMVCGKRDGPFNVAPEDGIGPNYGAVYPCVQNIFCWHAARSDSVPP